MKKLLLILLCLPMMTLAQLPTVTLSGGGTICADGSTAQLYFTLGGDPNFTVDYTVNGVPASSVFTSTGVNTLNVTPPVGINTYVLTSITDGNGLVENNVSGSVTIIVHQLPLVTISQNGNVLFVDSISASMPINYYWSTGSTSDTIHINQIGTYSVVVTDANGCTGISSITVTSLSTGIFDFFQNTNKTLLKITDILGRKTNQTNQPLFYIYDDGTVEKRIVIE
jgi:hypothetical protein